MPMLPRCIDAKKKFFFVRAAFLIVSWVMLFAVGYLRYILPAPWVNNTAYVPIMAACVDVPFTLWPAVVQTYRTFRV